MSGMAPLGLEEAWRRMFAREVREVGRELTKAAAGDDRGVHRGRKAIQRVRAALRLVRSVDDSRVRRLDAGWRRLRRRLGALRDAAVRCELVAAQLDRREDAVQQQALLAVLPVLQERRAEVWARHGAEFWDRVLADFERLRARSLAFSPGMIFEADFLAPLERARRRCRAAIEAAMGRDQRSIRHEARRLLRRYAVMRRTAAQLARRPDRYANTLQELARKIGSEGDLWLTAVALRAVPGSPALRQLRATLEKERRRRCRGHDGACAVVLRRIEEKHVPAG